MVGKGAAALTFATLLVFLHHHSTGLFGKLLASYKELEIKFPTGSAEIQRAVEGFESISFQSAIKNVLLCWMVIYFALRHPRRLQLAMFGCISLGITSAME